MQNDMGKKSVKRYSLSKTLLAILLSAVVWLCGLVTVSETLNLPFVPTWNELYVMSGLREDIELPDSQLRMTVLDVGNADCILLQNGDRFALIDAGENDDGDDIVSYFQRVGITRLEYVIVTHPDADHIGGMDDVVRNVEIGTFLMSYMPEGYTPTTRVYENLLTALIERDVTPIDPAFGTVFSFGDAYIDIFSGLSEHTDTNEQSIVCRVRFGENRFLLMGDAGKEVEEELLDEGIDLRADVLKVGHHGSRTSSSEPFVKAVMPTYAVITCGTGNSYNHPHSQTLDVLRQFNCAVYRCDVHGDIVLTSDGKTIAVTTEK